MESERTDGMSKKPRVSRVLAEGAHRDRAMRPSLHSESPVGCLLLFEQDGAAHAEDHERRVAMP